MGSLENYRQLQQALNDVRQSWRRRQVWQAFLVGSTVVTGLLVLVVAADNLLQPGMLGRLVLALPLWGSVVVLIGWLSRRWAGDRRDDFFASLVEEKHPELDNRLINAIQLGRASDNGSGNGYSKGLVEAVVDDATRATAELDLPSSLDSRPLKRAAKYAGGALLVLALYGLVFWPRFANGLGRILFPVADIPAYTETRINEDSIKPGNTKLAEGSALTVEMQVEGVVPATAQLARLMPAGTQNLVMQPDKNASDRFRLTLAQLSESFSYRLAAGDGSSREYKVEVIKRPRVETLALTLTPPAYTGQPPRKLEGQTPEINALPGTQVKVEVKSSKPIEKAKLITAEGVTIPLEKAAEPDTWQVAFTLWGQDIKAAAPAASRLLYAPTRYQIRLVDDAGLDNADPVWYPVTLARDNNPTVAITLPGKDVPVQPEKTVNLTIDARDDYGVGEIKLLYRINESSVPKELIGFPQDGPPRIQTSVNHAWDLAALKNLKAGDVVQYWATATDRNNLTGPGQGQSRKFFLYVVTPELVRAQMDLKLQDLAQIVEELLRLQKENRAQTASGNPFDVLVKRQTLIRNHTDKLVKTMEKDPHPLATMIATLEELHGGLMAEAIRLLETGRDTSAGGKAAELRNESLPVQDKIIAALEGLLARLQRNEQARQALKKMEKNDPKNQQKVVKALGDMLKDLDRLLQDQTELAGKFEKLPPRKNADPPREDEAKALKDLDEMQSRWDKWAKGSIQEMTKMPQGFVDDFNMRPDVNKVFEEIEKAAQRAKAQKIEVGLEDLGAGLATKMKEDLEMWLPDSPDSAKWVLEEPLNQKPMKIPEMPLPNALEDLVGDLMQKAEEFDEEADDVTSAWGDNLDQAGWGVSDGPISSFSAKGKTGNDQPNNMELSGRSGDGRRGKSSGQMVGDTARALEGRKTPARVGNEKYEPGQLKQEGREDPNGATGGGKRAGSGRKGLQGGTPPDISKDLERLSAKQAGVREKAEQVAKKLEAAGVRSKRLGEGIDLMKSAEKDLRDLRYDDAARKRKQAMGKIQGIPSELDQSTAAHLNRARDLPPHLRSELLQAADESYPPGYEALLKTYFKSLSGAEK